MGATGGYISQYFYNAFRLSIISFVQLYILSFLSFYHFKI